MGVKSRRPGSGPLRAILAAVLALAAYSTALVIRARHSVSRPSEPPSLPASQSPRPAAAAPASFKFVGSAVCRDCHEKNYTRWASSWHARALAPANAVSVVGSFAGVHFKGESSEAWMSHKGERYLVRTRDQQGQLGDYAVDWVIGGKRMQDPLTALPDGRWQVLPVYYHVTAGRWVDYNEAKQGVVGPDHPFFWTNFRRTANRECLDCHATGVDVRYDRSAERWTTSFVDAGVACEACHGPGGRHAETKDKRDIVQPNKVTAELGLAICGQCHGTRNPLFPLLDSAHRFRPGEPYEEKYQAFVLTDGRRPSPDFFADGRPRSSSYEYPALLQSACHRKGGATCLSCHTAPHQEHGPDDLKPGAAQSSVAAAEIGDVGCRSCHASVFAAGEAHTHHNAPAAQRCAACHMPKLLSGVLDKFADHALDVPVPENTERHGIPNACNECHADQSPATMSAALAARWPGASARQARRLRLADAFDTDPQRRSRPGLEAVLADASEDPSLRGAAALLLAGRFHAEAAPALGRALHDPSSVVRSLAATAVGFAPSSDGVAGLSQLGQDPSLAVRHAAGLTLGILGAPEGEGALKALATDPASAGLVRPHVLLAAYAARRGDLGEAAAQLETALRLQPYQVDALILLAQVRGHQNRWGEARACLEEALRFDPQNGTAAEGLRSIPAPPRGSLSQSHSLSGSARPRKQGYHRRLGGGE